MFGGNENGRWMLEVRRPWTILIYIYVFNNPTQYAMGRRLWTMDYL